MTKTNLARLRRLSLKAGFRQKLSPHQQITLLLRKLTRSENQILVEEIRQDLDRDNCLDCLTIRFDCNFIAGGECFGLLLCPFPRARPCADAETGSRHIYPLAALAASVKLLGFMWAFRAVPDKNVWRIHAPSATKSVYILCTSLVCLLSY